MTEINILTKYKLFIFDLDNTLYNENDFLFHSYLALSAIISDKLDESTDSVAIFEFLVKTFKEDGRQQLFDKLIKHFNWSVSLNNILHIFRQVNNFELNLYPWVSPFFIKLKKHKLKNSICTNGNVIQQKRKFVYLGLDKICNHIEYADMSRRKPEPDALYNILNVFNISNSKAVYIGDSSSDCTASNSADIDFIYVDRFLKIIGN